MSYHDEAYRLAGVVASPSASALAAVEALELRWGRRLPAAFRALLTASAYPSWIAERTSDHPIPVERLALDAGRVAFMVENQGVARWAVEVEGDDPRVMVLVDGRPAWRLCCESLEAWVWCLVFDAVPAAYAAQAGPLSARDVALLEARFRPAPRTFGWPGDVSLRFSHPAGDVLLWSAADQCDWWVRPRVASSALELLDLLPVEGEARRCFYALSADGSAALDRWRAPG